MKNSLNQSQKGTSRLDAHAAQVALATSHGWVKLRRGWYHPFAWNYVGWFDDPRCYKTIEELCDAEGI